MNLFWQTVIAVVVLLVLIVGILIWALIAEDYRGTWRNGKGHEKQEYPSMDTDSTD